MPDKAGTCHLCGKTLKHLGSHLGHVHNIRGGVTGRMRRREPTPVPAEMSRTDLRAWAQETVEGRRNGKLVLEPANVSVYYDGHGGVYLVEKIR